MKKPENSRRSYLTRKQRRFLLMFAVVATMLLITSLCCFASGEGTGSTTGFNLNIDITQMFTWAQTILDAMMPVVYVTLGISLGFLIINALKNAFNRF